MLLSFTFEFTLIVTLGFLGGALARKLKQPAVVGYLVVGFLASFLFSGFLNNREAIDAIAEIGVALLLFTVGIELNLSRFKRIMKIAIIGGAVQILINIIAFRFILLVFGLPPFESLFIAAAFSLSSTAIVVKMLIERGMNESLPAEIMTSWLLVQDLAVVPLLVFLPFFSDQAGETSLVTVLLTIGKASLFIVILFLLGKRVVGKSLSRIARGNSRELLLLATVSLCLIVAFLTEWMGMSFVLGAFFAGVLVSETTEQHAVFNEVKPLRDLFAVIFFITLTLLIPFEEILQNLPVALVISLIVILVKFLVVLGVGLIFRLHTKVAFVAAISLVQVGEFSFVLARYGLDKTMITNESYSLVLTVTILTLIASPFLFNNAERLYVMVKKVSRRVLPLQWYKYFEKIDQSVYEKKLLLENHVVLCGYGRMGRYIGRALERAGIPFVVIEFNRTLVYELREKGITAIYGDPANSEILEHAEIAHAKLLISAVPDIHTQLTMVRHAKRINSDLHVIVRVHREEDQKNFRKLGADSIIQPEFAASLDVVEKSLALFHKDEKEIQGKIKRLKIEHATL